MLILTPRPASLTLAEVAVNVVSGPDARASGGTPAPAHRLIRTNTTPNIKLALIGPHSFERLYGNVQDRARDHSPPRRGGVAAPLRKCREATEAAQTGWSDRPKSRACRSSIEASPYRARATPPLRGGE